MIAGTIGRFSEGFRLGPRAEEHVYCDALMCAEKGGIGKDTDGRRGICAAMMMGVLNGDTW